MWALDDFTADNGATHIYLNSHTGESIIRQRMIALVKSDNTSCTRFSLILLHTLSIIYFHRIVVILRDSTIKLEPYMYWLKNV